jgi:hypothetical protein
MPHRPVDGCVHVGPVVYEVGQLQFDAVHPLLGPDTAEPHVLAGHAGAVVEVVSVEPAQGALLYS